MLKRSTRLDYGLLAMIDLAEHVGDGTVQSREIAERRGVPEPYLNQLLAMLRKSGLVISRRGPGGGHFLAKAPDDIRLLDVVESLDGPIVVLEEAGDRSFDSKSPVVAEVWERLAESTRAYLSSVSLGDLLERERRRTVSYQI